MGRVVGRLRREKEEVGVSHGAVTAKHPLAAAAALDVLERGGNAVDAAVVATLCTGVLLPLASGIGGGGYLLFHEAASGRTQVVDYASESPASAHAEMYPPHPEGGFSTAQGWRRVAGDTNLHGWLSMAVPGSVAGLSLALERWGTLSWAEALAPAIELAEAGFPAPQELVHQFINDWRVLAAHPSSWRTFTDHGRPFKPAERVRWPDLARTLRRLAAAGPRDFYEGEIGRAIAADMAEHGGHITAADLAAYSPRLPDAPLSLTYRDVTVHTVPGSAGGITALQTLALLEGFPLSSLQPESEAALHLWDVASRLAFADRAMYAGDATLVDVPWHGLLHADYIAERRALIGDAAGAGYEAGDPWQYEGRPRPAATYAPSRPWEPGGTQHVSVVDRQRNAVALTDTTVSWSGVALPRTGIVMNNAMTWHNPEPGRANSVAPRRRGLNNMTPSILLRDGRLFASLGARGGRRIIGTVAQVISNLVDYRLGPQAAVTALSDSSQPALVVDPRVPEPVRAALRDRGHRVEVAASRAGAGAGAIVVQPHIGRLLAGEDPSGESAAAGY